MQVDEQLIASLLATAGDESKAESERYGALKHACQLRGDNYQHVPIDQLKLVAAALHPVELCGRVFGPLKMKDASEAVAAGFARRAAGSVRR